MGPAEARVLMLTVRGVAAVNMNNWPAAKQDFLDAYALDPTSAFSLNNRGYVAEKDGDLETAQFFYNKARQAADSDARVGSATNQNAEGKTLATVSADSHQNVDGELERYSAQRHRQTGPIELTPRDTVPTNAEDPSSKLPSASH
jgi:tetratricopeptide (TPR) repeat protein